MKYIILKTHAKDAAGLYRSGEVFDGNQIESLKQKIEAGLVREFEPIFTKEEKKTRRK